MRINKDTLIIDKKCREILHKFFDLRFMQSKFYHAFNYLTIKKYYLNLD